MNTKKVLKIVQAVLIVIAIFVLVIPMIYVGLSTNGLSSLTSNVLISASIFLSIGATAIAIFINPEKRAKKIGLMIGLLIVLISRWV